MTTTTLSGFSLKYSNNTDDEIGVPIYVEPVSVSFTYEENVRVSYGQGVTAPKGILNVPEVAFSFSGGYFQANRSLDPQGTLAKLTFSNGSFATIVSVYNSAGDKDYVLLLDSSSDFVVPTDQTSLDQLLSGIVSVQPLTGLLAPDSDIRLSDIPASASVENDVFIGTDAGDVINGGAGDDRLDGGDGEDTLDGGAGNDTLIGGNGADTASYASATAAVTVNLELTTAQNTFGAGIDTLTTIENLTGSNFNDTLTGSSSANEINGGNGDDVINGGKGHDTLDGGAGNDTLNGDDGTDTASYASATAGVVVSLELTAAQNTVGAGTDTLIAIASLKGSDFDDILTGNSGFNVLDGGAGNDTLIGGAGNDTYFVDSTNDRVYETTTTSSSNTTDTGGTDRIFSSVSLSLDDYNGVQFVENLLLQGSNNINGTGNSLNNTITGNSSNNVLDGGAGDDIIAGRGGDDTLTGGSDADIFQFHGVFDHDKLTDFDETEDKLEFYTVDGSELQISDLVETVNSAGHRVLSTADGQSSVTFASTGGPVFPPTFDIDAGDNFVVNTFQHGKQNGFTVSSSLNNSFLTTWSSLGQDGSSTGVYSQLVGTSGEKLGPEIPLNTTTMNEQSGVSLASFSDGSSVAIWVSWLQDGDKFGVYGQLFDKLGDKIGSEFRVSDTTYRSQENAKLSILNNDSFVAVWQDDAKEGQGYGIFAQIFDKLGNRIGGEFQVNTNTYGEQVTPRVVETTAGGFVVTWRTRTDLSETSSTSLHTQKFDSNGEKIGSEITLDYVETHHAILSDVAALSNDGYVAVWTQQDNAGYNISYQIFNSDGNEVSDILELKKPTGFDFTYSQTHKTDNGFLISWQSYNNEATISPHHILIQTFDQFGAPSSEQTVLQNKEINWAGQNAQFHFIADVSVNDNGKGLVLWTGNDPLYDSEVNATPFQLVARTTPAFDIVLASQSDGVAKFEIYADASVDPDNDGIGSFEFTLSHDPSDLLIDIDSFAAASGISGVPNYDATTGTLEAAAFAFPNFEDLSAPIATFSATILDTDNPVNLTISNAIVDRVAQDDVVETFDFSSVSITTTIVDRFGDDLVLQNDDVFAFEISGGDQVFVREKIIGSDTSTVIEIVANPTSEFSALDFDLTDYAGLTDFTLSDALSNWTSQTNTTVADQVSFSGFSNDAEIPAGQETVLATFTTSIDPDFDISGIKLDGAAEPDVSVGEIPAASTNGNVTVFEVSRNSDTYVNAYKPIDEASEEAIGAYDALQALRLAVGLTKSDGTAEWHDYLAADINRDGRVGADDALDILKFAVGLTDGAPADWIFVDGDADWSGIDRRNTDYDEGIMLEDVLVDTSINMTGILVGDLDGSYIV